MSSLYSELERSERLQIIKTECLSEDSGGNEFDDGPRGEIKGIRITYSSQIDSIQVVYGDDIGDQHGGDEWDSSATDVTDRRVFLKEGEDVVEVTATELSDELNNDTRLTCLQFKTNKDRSIEFNTRNTNDGERRTFVAPEGFALAGIHGTAEKYVNTIGVYWTGSLSKRESTESLAKTTSIADTTGSWASTKKKPLPWYSYAIMVSCILLLAFLLLPVWSDYHYAIGEGRTCKVWIGPWGHYTRGSDDCDLGYRKHDRIFYCNLGIDGVELDNIFDCRSKVKQGSNLAIVAVRLAFFCAVGAFCASIIAWRKNVWKGKIDVICISIAFTYFTIISVGLSWIGWKKVYGAMDSVLEANKEATKSESSVLLVSVLIHIIAGSTFIVAATRDCLSIMSNQKTTETEIALLSENADETLI